VTLEGKPRTCDANDAVVAILSSADGLGQGLCIVSLPGVPTPSGKVWKPQLHEKLYCFSHPKPIAFIGSFNPSGDDPEERPDIIREIGDQDRGHNVLVGLSDPILCERLVSHARAMNRVPTGLLYRFSRSANQALIGVDTEIHFWPRVCQHPVVQFLRRAAPGARVRIAASHIRSGRTVKIITALAQRGVSLKILAEPTLRRVPAGVERRLTAAGIPFRRLRHPEGLPMHNKFVLLEEGDRRWTIFGSFNWTKPSYWLNHEIAAICSDPRLFNAFAERWEMLESQNGAQYG
jgi:phosphatidylserine/phosphatidylglycerophosphate/cardiolipin synthase-like enzyme